MVTSVQIGQAGESAAVSALKAKGWKIDKWDTKAPGSTDIEASSSGSKLLVQVKAAVAPENPASLSSDEEHAIKSRATRVGAIAYEASVTLDKNLNTTNISWRKLT